MQTALYLAGSQIKKADPGRTSFFVLLKVKISAISA